MQPDEFTRDLKFKGVIRTTVDKFFIEIVKNRLLRPGDDTVIRSILSGKNVEISFSDSYLNSAMSSLMLVYLIKGFKEEFNFKISFVNLQINGPKRNCNNPSWNANSNISFNFACESDANRYTRELFEEILSTSPVFSSIAPDHCRWIRFRPDNGDKYIEFRPDYGIDGGWRSYSKYIDLDILDGSTPIETRGISIVYYLLIKTQ